MTNKEIAGRLGLNQSTASRCLSELVRTDSDVSSCKLYKSRTWLFWFTKTNIRNGSVIFREVNGYSNNKGVMVYVKDKRIKKIPKTFTTTIIFSNIVPRDKKVWRDVK